METIFDHNPTKEECEELRVRDKEKYLANINEMWANYGLAALYHLRKNEPMVQKYLSRLPKYVVLDFNRRFRHPF